MTATRIDALVWVAIYLGLALVGLGLALNLSLRQADKSALGWTVFAIGAGSCAAGVFLIWLRSRMPEDDGP